VLSTKLSSILQLPEEVRLNSYTSELLKKGIIGERGVGKGSSFFVNPKIISNSKANLKTSLKTIEPYRLKALIIEDLRFHPNSRISEIATRLPDVEYKELRKMLYDMVGKKEIIYSGGRAYRKYDLREHNW
jgi:ATP-dependent DNA helicase RecG